MRVPQVQFTVRRMIGVIIFVALILALVIQSERAARLERQLAEGREMMLRLGHYDLQDELEAAREVIARIARDQPDILERMKAGEFLSVHAADRNSHIVRPTTMIYIDSPADATRTILRHSQGERLVDLIRELRNLGN